MTADAERRSPEPRKARGLRTAPIVHLFSLLLIHPGRLALALCFLLMSAIAMLAIPPILGRIVDAGFLGANIDAVGQYAWIIIVIAGVMAAANGARAYFIASVSERAISDLRHSVYAHLLGLETAFFDAQRVGELTSRLNSDVATIRGVVANTLGTLIRSVIILTGALAIMTLTNPRLALVVIIGVPLLIYPALYLSRRLRKASRGTQDALAELSALATEMLGANRAVKSFTQEEAQAELYRQRGESSYGSELNRLIARSLLSSVVMFVTISAVVLLIWYGASLVIGGALSIGQLTQFLAYAYLASGALISLSDGIGALQALAGSMERLMELLRREPGIRAPAHPVALPDPSPATVAFDNVVFAYATGKAGDTLSELSFFVGSGETVALVGPSGAGKSTVFSLIERFYDVAGGAVRVDGVDVRDVDPIALRRRIAFVEQEPVIFAGTVADNIRFGGPDASDAAVLAAAEAALVTEFAAELPLGLDTMVGERGVLLSGGQKQRIAIARAILKDAPILLLDEATSALDTINEHLVRQALDRLRQGRTTLVIAHRLSTVRNADRLLVLEHGRLVESGTHDQLIALNGAYAALVRLQFRDDPNGARAT